MKISGYFTTPRLTACLRGAAIAVLGSTVLYFAWWGHPNPWIETPATLLFFFLLLGSGRGVWFCAGAGVGMLWFWWIPLSFRYYGFPWAILPAVALIGLLYGAIFWGMASAAELLASVAARLTRPLRGPGRKLWATLLKIPAIVALGHLHPFGFDWLRPGVLTLHTPFGGDDVRLGMLLGALALPRLVSFEPRIPKPIALLGALLLLTGALDFRHPRLYASDPAGKIMLAQTGVSIPDKWNPRNLDAQIETVLELIDRGIAQGYRTILLPESVLPLFLNRNPELLSLLKRRSRKIAIVLGALYSSEGRNRNSTYLFEDGRLQIGDKFVLVPFGEYNPLPAWAGRIVNRIFFDGAVDYSAASRPTDLMLHAKRWRSGICFEGTSERLYADDPKRLLLMSNNAWFTPSLEPALQRLLLEDLSRRHGTAIYHSVNGSPSYLIRP